MNCDRFERIMLDLLYDELDELTRAAANRHSDQCQRCRALFARLRTTREVGVLPLEFAPDGFESRILAAERQVHRGLPWTKRLARSVTIVGGYAMRPQLAMAALAMLMIGTSLLFLRPKPGSHASSVQVTQRGVPRVEPEQFVVPIEEAPTEAEEAVTDDAETAKAEAVAAASAEPAREASPVAAASAAVAAPSNASPAVASSAPIASEQELDLARERAEDRAYTAAMSAFQESNHLAAQRQFDAIVAAGGRNAPAAELYAALATEAVVGCSAALPRFDSVAAKYSETHLAHTATWHSASCRSQLGLDRRAALDFERLLRVPAYSARARVALSQVHADAVDRNRGLRPKDRAPSPAGAPMEAVTVSNPVGGTPSMAVQRSAPQSPTPRTKGAPPGTTASETGSSSDAKKTVKTKKKVKPKAKAPKAGSTSKQRPPERR